jgi:hypothetical protein
MSRFPAQSDTARVNIVMFVGSVSDASTCKSQSDLPLGLQQCRHVWPSGSSRLPCCRPVDKLRTAFPAGTLLVFRGCPMLHLQTDYGRFDARTACPGASTSSLRLESACNHQGVPGLPVRPRRHDSQCHARVPPAAGLFDPAEGDKDACGVGFVGELEGTLGCVTDALGMLVRMAHQGPYRLRLCRCCVRMQRLGASRWQYKLGRYIAFMLAKKACSKAL